MYVLGLVTKKKEKKKHVNTELFWETRDRNGIIVETWDRYSGICSVEQETVKQVESKD